VCWGPARNTQAGFRSSSPADSGDILLEGEDALLHDGSDVSSAVCVGPATTISEPLQVLRSCLPDSALPLCFHLASFAL
jgi:hypothetical protein